MSEAAKKKQPVVKPQDNHASDVQDGELTTKDNHASGGVIKPLDNHASSEPTKPLDNHASGEPA
ncbi:hypothetical protein ACFVT5_11195 [Streptomyces sp. NPDC058001]|uniref:hypothetical protein n=1 Tax=Streptomyces sp. NPDC058001 TaxID=3346300 RepID=UPI0036EA797D